MGLRYTWWFKTKNINFKGRHKTQKRINHIEIYKIEFQFDRLYEKCKFVKDKLLHICSNHYCLIISKCLCLTCSWWSLGFPITHFYIILFCFRFFHIFIKSLYVELWVTCLYFILIVSKSFLYVFAHHMFIRLTFTIFSWSIRRVGYNLPCWHN